MREIKVGLIGDRSPEVIAHRAIPVALELSGKVLGCTIDAAWLPTSSLEKDPGRSLGRCDAAWCVPGSPYVSEAGALAAITFVRESGMPFLGTCGGCQHAILEFARNVLGLKHAAHAETDPTAELPLISPLSCALVEATGTITLVHESMIHRIYGKDSIEETYHCRYGLNPRLEHLLVGSGLKVTGRDAAGEVRAMELAGMPFYLLTQFQPERAALRGEAPHLAVALLEAAVGTPR
jgi:CTP synthase (UTP-ammonia lyase)